jgi:hypothetical protein
MMNTYLRPSWRVLALAVVPLIFLGCPRDSKPPAPVATIKPCNGGAPCFLTKKGNGSVQEAQTYYDTIDPPPSKKDTLPKWLDQNGFNSPLPADTAHAVYFNNGDLQIGRDMYCRMALPTLPALRVACYVTNYGPVPGTPTYPDETAALNDAIAAQNPAATKKLFATVAMEYDGSPIFGLGNPRQVDFYVFDDKDNRIPAAALDSEGPKAIPQMCMTCHGGTYDSQTHHVTGASFLSFDVFSFHYSQSPGYRQADQEEQFRKLNAMVKLLDTTPDIVSMIDTLYPQGVANMGSTASDTQVPTGWGSQPNLYKNFFTPYCRTCHVASKTFPFSTYQDFKTQASLIRGDVCRAHVMPQAQVPFNRIWTPALGFLLSPFVLDDTTVMPPPTGPPDAKCAS